MSLFKLTWNWDGGIITYAWMTSDYIDTNRWSQLTAEVVTDPVIIAFYAHQKPASSGWK